MKAVPKLYVEADPAAPMANEWVTWKLGVSTLVISQRAPSKTWLARKVSIIHEGSDKLAFFFSLVVRLAHHAFAPLSKFSWPLNFVSRPESSRSLFLSSKRTSEHLHDS